MRFLHWGRDGGPESEVFGFWLLEIKSLFSIVLLRFEKSSRDVYHSHAFPALTWWLTGEVIEEHRDGRRERWVPSARPKFTPRACFHKVHPIRRTWALSIRGPWSPRWAEDRPGEGLVHLRSGRQVVGRG